MAKPVSIDELPARPGIDLEIAADMNTREAAELLLNDLEASDAPDKGPVPDEPIESGDAEAEPEHDAELDAVEATEAPEVDEVEQEDAEGTDEPLSDATYDVVVDGDTYEVTANELISGYQFNESNTRKAMANAEARRELEQRATDLTSERQQLASRLQTLEQVIRATMPPEPDWTNLNADQKLDLMRQQSELEKISQEQQEVLRRQQADHAVKQENTIESERQQLMDTNPEWQDDAVRTEEIRKMTEVAIGTYGWSAEDLAGTTDHRAFNMLRDATRYRDLVRQGKAVRKKATKSPTLKPGRAKSPKDKRNRETADLSAVRTRFAQSHSHKDAAALIERLMDKEG